MKIRRGNFGSGEKIRTCETMNAAADKNQNCALLIVLPTRKRGIKNLNSIESKMFMREKVCLSCTKRA